MIRLSSIYVSFFALILLALFAKDACALNLGSFDVNPYLDLAGHYDDNVFARDSNRVEDYYLQVSPGLALKYGGSDNLIELGYRADIYRYLDTGGLNNVEDHKLDAALHLNTDGRVWFKLDDVADKAHEPRSEAFASSAPLNKYYSNDLMAELGFKFSEKFGIALLYNNFFVDYRNEANNYRDRMDNGAGLSFNYSVLPKTRLLLQGVYKRVYHEDADPKAPFLNSYEYWAMTGVTWDITDKSTGSVRIGYEWKDFDYPSVNTFKTPVYLVSIDHRFTPKTSVVITGAMQAKETDDPNTTYYNTSAGSVRFNFNPVRKLEVSPYASFAHNRYSGATVSGGDRARRLENVWSCGTAIRYHMNKWLAVSAEYEHAKKSSTLTIFNYTRNAVSLMLSASL